MGISFSIVYPHFKVRVTYSPFMQQSPQKTRKSVSKRFKLTGSGKIKRNKAGHSHMLIRRDNDVKRAAKKSTLVAASDEKKVKKMMGK